MFGIKRTHWWSALTLFAPVNGAFMNLRPHLSLMVRGFLQSELCNNGKPNLLCATLISTRPSSPFHASLTAFSSFINDSIITRSSNRVHVLVLLLVHKINPNRATLPVTDKYSNNDEVVQKKAINDFAIISFKILFLFNINQNISSNNRSLFNDCFFLFFFKDSNRMRTW